MFFSGPEIDAQMYKFSFCRELKSSFFFFMTLFWSSWSDYISGLETLDFFRRPEAEVVGRNLKANKAADIDGENLMLWKHR